MEFSFNFFKVLNGFDSRKKLEKMLKPTLPYMFMSHIYPLDQKTNYQ